MNARAKVVRKPIVAGLSCGHRYADPDCLSCLAESAEARGDALLEQRWGVYRVLDLITEKRLDCLEVLRDLWHARDEHRLTAREFRALAGAAS